MEGAGQEQWPQRPHPHMPSRLGRPLITFSSGKSVRRSPEVLLGGLPLRRRLDEGKAPSSSSPSPLLLLSLPLLPLDPVPPPPTARRGRGRLLQRPAAYALMTADDPNAI